MIVVRVDPQFESDLDAAITWYETISADVADDFRQPVSNCFASVSSYPESYPIVELPLRVAILKRFPWLVVYRHEPDLIILLRFVHSASSQFI